MDDIPSVRLLAGEPAEPLLLRTVHGATGEVKWDLLKATGAARRAGEPIAAVTIIEDVTARRPPSCASGSWRAPPRR